MKRLMFAGMILLLAMAETAQGEWEYMNSGVTESLRDICFVDEIHGWAVGLNSTIISSADGGYTWMKQSCPIDGRELKNVTFINGTDGMCISDKFCFYTLDGGMAWKETVFDFSLKVSSVRLK